MATTQLAKDLGLYGAGQDLLSDAFSGNLRGMGPGYAEVEIEERPSEPVLCFLADKTEPGAWNLPLYRIFADPFNTAGLVIDPKMHGGFLFEATTCSKTRASCSTARRSFMTCCCSSGRRPATWSSGSSPRPWARWRR
jgi:fructose 1,6-bisphosphatase